MLKIIPSGNKVALHLGNIDIGSTRCSYYHRCRNGGGGGGGGGLGAIVRKGAEVAEHIIARIACKNFRPRPFSTIKASATMQPRVFQ